MVGTRWFAAPAGSTRLVQKLGSLSEHVPLDKSSLFLYWSRLAYALRGPRAVASTNRAATLPCTVQAAYPWFALACAAYASTPEVFSPPIRAPLSALVPGHLSAPVPAPAPLCGENGCLLGCLLWAGLPAPASSEVMTSSRRAMPLIFVSSMSLPSGAVASISVSCRAVLSNTMSFKAAIQCVKDPFANARWRGGGSWCSSSD